VTWAARYRHSRRVSGCCWYSARLHKLSTRWKWNLNLAFKREPKPTDLTSRALRRDPWHTPSLRAWAMLPGGRRGGYLCASGRLSGNFPCHLARQQSLLYSTRLESPAVRPSGNPPNCCSDVAMHPQPRSQHQAPQEPAWKYAVTTGPTRDNDDVESAHCNIERPLRAIF
jgi:hypothetical protein